MSAIQHDTEDENTNNAQENRASPAEKKQEFTSVASTYFDQKIHIPEVPQVWA